MIIEQCIPKSKTNDPYFKYNIPFHGDITKTYTCQVVGSNAPSPKIIGFTTNETGQNMVILEFAATCNNRQMTIEFMTLTEVVEENKIKFLTWLLGYFTWFNFIFRIFSVKTLKKITVIIAGIIAVPIIGGLIYAAADLGYEAIYDESLDDSEFVQWIDDFRFRKIGNYFLEDAVDDAGEFKDFMKEKTADAYEVTKEKAEDITETIADKIEDIRD